MADISSIAGPILPMHPELATTFDELVKWRIVFSGGDYFKDTYLKPISTKETAAEFLRRKMLTPIPAFATEGILEIRDMLFQHFPQVRRVGGGKAYQDAVEGLRAGVDMAGNSMDSFMGCEVALELLLMGRVGVLVDMPKLKGPTLADNPNHRPYLYYYVRENIINWVPDRSGAPNEFSSVLLKDDQYTYDDLGFPVSSGQRYRRIFKSYEDGQVYEQVWDAQVGFQKNEPTPLGISRVPFTLLSLSDSLMRRVADHQICLMNIESLDINYLLKSNFPFLVEQANPNSDLDTSSRGVIPGTQGGPDVVSRKKVINAGVNRGRTYAVGASPPEYIHPSSEPMKASIDKQEQLKIDIRRLLTLSLSQIKQNTGSTAKGTINPQVDSTTNGATESGLAAVGLVLETGEQKIASYWAEYETGRPGDGSTAYVSYPRTYNTKSDGARLEEADKLAKMIDKTPSKTYQRVCAKELAETLFGGKIPTETMDKIKAEIEKAEIVQTDATTIGMDILNGLADPEAASKARGYPEGSVEKAQKFAAQRAAAIVIAQTKGAGHAANADPSLTDPASRGAPDLAVGGAGDQAKKEKQVGKAGAAANPRAPNPGGGQADRNKIQKGK